MAELINSLAVTARWFIGFILCCMVGVCIGGMIALAVAFPLPCIVFLLLWICSGLGCFRLFAIFLTKMLLLLLYSPSYTVPVIMLV